MARELGSGDACQHSGGAKGAWTDKPPDIALGEAASLVTRILILPPGRNRRRDRGYLADETDLPCRGRRPEPKRPPIF